jgi:hypothetical protein
MIQTVPRSPNPTTLPTVRLRLRLVGRGQPAVPRLERINTFVSRFYWLPAEGVWRSQHALYAAVAERERGAQGAFHAIARLADGPIYHLALRIPGTITDEDEVLQRRLDSMVRLVPPREWACRDCQDQLRRRGAPCARHLREMPPAILWAAHNPRVAKDRRYWVFGFAQQWPSNADPSHNDRDLEPADLAEAQAALEAPPEDAAEEGVPSPTPSMSVVADAEAWHGVLFGPSDPTRQEDDAARARRALDSAWRRARIDTPPELASPLRAQDPVVRLMQQGKLGRPYALNQDSTSPTYRTRLTDGRRVLIKFDSRDAQEGNRLRDCIDEGNERIREYAAAYVGDVLRASGVEVNTPTVVIRDISTMGFPGETERDGRAVVMSWADHVGERGGADLGAEARHGFVDLPPARQRDFAFFDHLIGNTDRHDQNYFIAKDGQDLFPVDHGLSFPTGPAIPDPDDNKDDETDLGNGNFGTNEFLEIPGNRALSPLGPEHLAAIARLRSGPDHEHLRSILSPRAMAQFDHRLAWLASHRRLPINQREARALYR